MMNMIKNVLKINGEERLKGNTVIITASTDGIGLAIAERLAAEGAKVVVSSRRIENVNRAVEYLKQKGYENVLGVKCHVSNDNERKQLFEKTIETFGSFNGLISNAAVNPYFGKLSECPIDIWDKVFDVNFRAAYQLTIEATKYMKLYSKESVCNILFISTAAVYIPNVIPGPYSVSKSVLMAFTKALCNELAHDNIRVNCIAPGLIDTKFSQTITNTKTGSDLIQNVIPMRRIGEPHEIASAAAFLISKDASYITGETITVAGGTPPHKI